MNSNQALNAAQMQLLQLIGNQREVNLLKARTSLSWDLEKFAVALHSLETAGLINRSGFKAASTAAGSVVLGARLNAASPNKKLGGTSHSYLDEVRVDRIPVSELWLPNLERFSRAVRIRK